MRCQRLAALLFGIIFAIPASAIQIGPEIRVGPREFTVGGAGFKDGKPVPPTLDQLIDNYINSTPLVVLSDADKKNVREAAKTTGYVAAVVSNPVTGLVLISVLQPDGTKQDIPVPVINQPPSKKTWSFT